MRATDVILHGVCNEGALRGFKVFLGNIRIMIRQIILPDTFECVRGDILTDVHYDHFNLIRLQCRFELAGRG